MDILLLAVREDRMLPDHVQSWLGLCLGLRNDSKEGALVVLVAKAAETAERDSSLLEYLETEVGQRTNLVDSRVAGARS